VYIGTVAIGLTIIEMSEEVEARYVNGKFIRETDYIQPKRETSYTWTTTKEFPTGKLRLQAYSPYPGTEWTKCWQETKKLDLCTKIKGIVRELQKDTVEIVKLIEKAASEAEIRHREWEAQQEKWRIEEEERRAVEALKESKSELYQIISSWAEANRIEHFFIDAEKHANNLSENEKNKILERLKLARKLIGRIDALDRFTVWRAPDER
jgi:vacuolar-type H+-ATPase subunit I/STV1